jgi:hypothetical protein
MVLKYPRKPEINILMVETSDLVNCCSWKMILCSLAQTKCSHTSDPSVFLVLILIGLS